YRLSSLLSGYRHPAEAGVQVRRYRTASPLFKPGAGSGFRFRGKDEVWLPGLRCVSAVRFSFRPQAVPGVGLTGRLDAHRVDRRARGEEDRPEIGPAKAQVGRDLGRADDAEPRAVRREYPGAAGPGAIDAALDIDLHA